MTSSQNLPPSPSRRNPNRPSVTSPGGTAAPPSYDQKVVEAMKEQLDQVKHRLELSETECARMKVRALES